MVALACDARCEGLQRQYFEGVHPPLNHETAIPSIDIDYTPSPVTVQERQSTMNKMWSGGGLSNTSFVDTLV